MFGIEYQRRKKAKRGWELLILFLSVYTTSVVHESMKGKVFQVERCYCS